MIVDTIIFPSSVFNAKKVDEDLKNEYDAVVSTGLYKIALFDYIKWFDEDLLIVYGVPDKPCRAVYRGWMMKPEKYEQFYSILLTMGIELITAPDEYYRLHIFPNAYKYVEEDTVKMMTFPLHSRIDINALKKEFGKFMVKDYVKSVKGTEFPRYFDNTVTQKELDERMEVFYKYRGNLLTGGICIKEYVNLKRYGDKTNEYRIFYENHEEATICRNSGQGNYVPKSPEALVEKYKGLPSPYYTVDVAELEDGTWIIIEVGDGSVSGLSDGQDYSIGT